MVWKPASAVWGSLETGSQYVKVNSLDLFWSAHEIQFWGGSFLLSTNKQKSPMLLSSWESKKETWLTEQQSWTSYVKCIFSIDIDLSHHIFCFES